MVVGFTTNCAFKQAQDLLYAMAAKTPVCIIVLLIMVCLMVIKATFNNISVISWLSVLLVEETYSIVNIMMVIFIFWLFNTSH
jgi:hypothetical protein